MKFTFGIPTTIIFEEDCVLHHLEIFASLGKNALLVTGKHSAKECGALDDVVEVLTKQSITYTIFDEIENNPSVETVNRASQIAREQEVDFVIGIGGGSPIDASKAIAVLAAHTKMQAQDLFLNDFKKVLPFIAIPTTAGTGSEVTPYSVLVRHDMETKVSFGNSMTYPRLTMIQKVSIANNPQMIGKEEIA